MIWHPSPNFGDRRGAATPDLVVIHYTAMASAEAARDWLCNPESQVSAHYVIGRDGTAWQLVDEAKRAWHAGAGSWRGCCDVNSRSIGIELANTGAEPFPEPQMRALEDLLRGIMARWPVPLAGVIGHSDMAPGRKIDPGLHFDWRRLALQGLSVWPERDRDARDRDARQGARAESRVSPASVEELLTDVGYTAEVTAAQRLAAFRLRFRPGAEGPADAVDAGLLTALV